MADDAADVRVEDDPVDRSTPEPAENDTNCLVFIALLTTLAIDGALAAAVAVLDVGYGQGIAHIIGVGLWAAVALLNGVAAFKVAVRQPHRFASVLLAQITALVLAAYVLLAASQSPVKNVPVRWVAIAVVAAAVWWIVYLLAKAPMTSTRTFSRGWKVISASFALMSLFSIWLTTTYLPSTARPMVDLTTSLTKGDQNADSTVMKATITLHNRGLAPAVIVGSLYRVYYQYQGGLAFTGPIFIDRFGDFASASDATTHQDDVLKAAFDLTAPNDNAFTGQDNVLKADEIVPMREFLLPGQTWSTESVFRVPTGTAATVRLTAQIALITDRYLGDTRACQGATTNQLGDDFQKEAHVVHVGPATRSSDAASPTGSSSPTDSAGPPVTRQLDFMCVQTALEPQSEVQNLVGNHPSIRSYYVLSDGDLYEDRVPYLVTTFQTAESTTDLEGRARQAQKIDAKNPSAVLESRSEYGVPGTAGTSGG